MAFASRTFPSASEIAGIAGLVGVARVHLFSCSILSFTAVSSSL